MMVDLTQCSGSALMTPNSQLRYYQPPFTRMKLKPKEGNNLPKVNSAGQWQGWDVNLGSDASQSGLFFTKTVTPSDHSVKLAQGCN